MLHADPNTITTDTQKDQHDRIIEWTEKVTNPNGNQVSKRVDEYSYYPTGEVDIITLNIFSGQHLVSTHLIKHYRNATQPLTNITFKQHP